MEPSAPPPARHAETLVQHILAGRAEAATAHVEAAVYTLDPRWRFTYVNTAAEAVLGRRCDELLGRTIWSEFPDLVGSRLEEIYRHTARTREHHADELPYPPLGRTVAINVYADDLGLSVCLRDAEERRRRRQQLADASEHMRSVLDVVPLPVVVMEPNGRIRTASQRWARVVAAMAGHAPAAQDGANYFAQIERTASPDAARQLRERIDALGGPADDVRLDLRLELNEGATWFHVQASRVEQTGLVVVTHTDVTGHVRAHHSAAWQATHDHLTSLANRARLNDLLALALEMPRRRPVALLFIDIDEFKSVNDRYGHDVGDDLLRAIAKRLDGCTRADDTVARLGGDEFVVLSHPVAPADAYRLEERLRAAFDEPFEVGSESLHIRISLGVATATGDEDVRRLLRRADQAMYADKRQRVS